MIKKRLLALMAESKTYIIQNIFWQWLGLLSSIITMGTAGWLFQTVWDGFISLSDCLPAAIVIFLCIGLRAYCSRRASAASANAGNDVKQELRQRLYEKLTRLGSSYHEKVPTAEAVQVAVEGVEQLEVYFGKYIPQLFYSILAPVTLFIVLSFVSLKASFVLLICVPLIPLTIMGVQKLAKRLLGRYWGTYTELGDSFLENLQGLTTLKIYQADGKKAKEMDQEAEHFRKNHHEGSDDAVKLHHCNGCGGLRRSGSGYDRGFARICRRHGFFRRHRYHDFAFRGILYPHAPAGLFFSYCHERHGGIRPPLCHP